MIIKVISVVKIFPFFQATHLFDLKCKYRAFGSVVLYVFSVSHNLIRDTELLIEDELLFGYSFVS